MSDLELHNTSLKYLEKSLNKLQQNKPINLELINSLNSKYMSVSNPYMLGLNPYVLSQPQTFLLGTQFVKRKTTYDPKRLEELRETILKIIEIIKNRRAGPTTPPPTTPPPTPPPPTTPPSPPRGRGLSLEKCRKLLTNWLESLNIIDSTGVVINILRYTDYNNFVVRNRLMNKSEIDNCLKQMGIPIPPAPPSGGLSLEKCRRLLTNWLESLNIIDSTGVVINILRYADYNNFVVSNRVGMNRLEIDKCLKQMRIPITPPPPGAGGPGRPPFGPGAGGPGRPPFGSGGPGSSSSSRSGGRSGPPPPGAGGPPPPGAGSSSGSSSSSSSRSSSRAGGRSVPPRPPPPVSYAGIPGLNPPPVGGAPALDPPPEGNAVYFVRILNIRPTEFADIQVLNDTWQYLNDRAKQTFLDIRNTLGGDLPVNSALLGDKRAIQRLLVRVHSDKCGRMPDGGNIIWCTKMTQFLNPLAS